MTKWLKRIGLALLVLILLTFFAAWWLLRGSLPQLDGELALPGLSAPVTIQRDKLGVVTIDAANETDAMRALGYVHAQERYFEMDLMRRTAAGELSELFGPIALETDKKHRIHRMRADATAGLDRIAGDKLPQLRAYVDGVQAGLHGLKARPWPYLLLRMEPEPWQMADSALTGYAMYFDLQDADNTREVALADMRPHLPAALFTLLSRDGTSWDAPLMGQVRGDARLPSAADVDLRKLPAPSGSALLPLAPKGTPGSNNFAVAGELTADGRAIVADDMHLGLRAPNIWFRVRLRYKDSNASGGKVDVSGFSLPGMPAIVVGSNGHIAWAFTNSYIDTVDRSGGGLRNGAARSDRICEAATAKTAISFETINVRGADPYVMPFKWKSPTTRDCVSSRWIAYVPGALSFDLTRLAAAGSVDQALQKPIQGMPAQNLLLADSSGKIAWTLAGAVPQRQEPCDPYGVHALGPPILRPGFMAKNEFDAHINSGASTRAAPQASLNGCWGELGEPPPQLRDPPSHRLWTANNRTLDGEALMKVGDGGYALGARAKQIRDDLFAKQTFAEKDLLAIQLDDRALFQQRWWQLLQSEAKHAKSSALGALAAAAHDWQGRASTDSVSYRIVRAWRLAVHARILDGLTAPAQAAMGENFVMPDVPQLEGVAWPLVAQRPMNLLSRRYTTWDALFEDAANEVRDELAKDGPLSERTWGERNTAAICHPLAKAIPLLGKRLLCMPPDPLPGDSAMPRVQGPAFGASERMVVSPGHEADGIVHMPGGQSGHFLSPFWGAGHDDWVHGRPTPFLPGETEYTLKMVPAH